MREFKVVRLDATGKELYDDFLMFASAEAADAWAKAENEARPGSVVDLEEVCNHAHSELKYEY